MKLKTILLLTILFFTPALPLAKIQIAEICLLGLIGVVDAFSYREFRITKDVRKEEIIQRNTGVRAQLLGETKLRHTYDAQVEKKLIEKDLSRSNYFLWMVKYDLFQGEPATISLAMLNLVFVPSLFYLIIFKKR